MSVKIINIWWGEHISLQDLESGKIGNNTDEDYGIYQIYGTHPIYGNDTLLYIGKASQQTFATRIKQEEHWWSNQNSHQIQIYFGKLIGNTPTETEWSEMISSAEKLLIYSHRPAHNSSNINSLREEDVSATHVLNWGNFKSLLPEVSSMRILDETKDDNEDYFNMANL